MIPLRMILSRPLDRNRTTDMNIIEWLGANVDAFDAIMYGLIAFAIWFFVWKLISILLEKHKLYSLLELGVVGSYGILLFLAVIIVLCIASIQAAISLGLQLLIPITVFLGALIAFFVFLIRKLKK